MARPKGGYKTADGKRCPGVTTIIGRYKESSGLIHWAYTQGLEGIDYRATRDRAADAGSIAHDMIEAHILGQDPFAVSGEEDLVKLATKGFDAFLVWEESSNIKITETETTIISEEYRFGGTLDALGLLPDGTATLLDWKSSNRVYSDYLLQIAAYRHLVEECTDMGIKIERCDLLRVGKEFGDFHHSSWPVEAIDIAWESFKAMRKLYEDDKVLKRLVGS